jgi:hypothetical protein
MMNKNFIFEMLGCSLLRAESFSCSFDVFYGGLGTKFLVIKTLEPDPDSLDPDPGSTNSDPQH